METFRCDSCGRDTPGARMKEVFRKDGGGETKQRLCPSCLDERMNAAEHVYGVVGEEKHRAAYLAEDTPDTPERESFGRRGRADDLTVEATGASPATPTSSAVETRPEQAAIAPREGTFTPQAARPTTSLPDAERSSETDPRRAEAGPAPGIEHERVTQRGGRPDPGT